MKAVTDPTYESPSLVERQKLTPQVFTEAEFQVDFKTMILTYDGIEMDYQNMVVNHQGLWIRTPDEIRLQKVELPPEILLKFDHNYIMDKYCCQIAKSLSRMTQSALIYSQKQKKQNNVKKFPLNHCLPLIDRIPTQTKLLVRMFKQISAKKIELLFMDNEIYIKIYKICYITSNPHKVKLQKDINIMDLQKIVDGLATSYERVDQLIKNFEYNSQLIVFLTDLNMCYVSSHIHDNLLDMLNLKEVSSQRVEKIYHKNHNTNQMNSCLTKFLKIIKTTLTCIGQSKKSFVVLKEMLLIDEVYHWFNIQFENISRYSQSRKLVIQIFGYLPIISVQFWDKLYSESKLLINKIITQQLIFFYKQKIALSSRQYEVSIIESISALCLQNYNKNSRLICLVVCQNFLDYFEWISGEELVLFREIMKICADIYSNSDFKIQIQCRIEDYINKWIFNDSQTQNMKNKTDKSLRIFQSKIKKNKLKLLEICQIMHFLQRNGTEFQFQLIGKLVEIANNSNDIFKNIVAKIHKIQRQSQDRQEDET